MQRAQNAPRVPDMWQLGLSEERARVALVGCGGAGCNILRQVVAPPNAIRIAMNDAVVPAMADVPARVIVPAAPLPGYATMDESAVPSLETDEEKEISAALLDRDVVLILGGLGGQLGGWGMGLVGRVARILGDATLAFATIPFGLEGPIRRQRAEAQLRLLQERADGVVTFGNDQLLQVAKDRPMAKALAALSAIMARPASNLAAVLARSDVAPLRRMLGGVREWRYGMGAGREKHRCFVAVEEAYASPWFTSLPDEVSHAVVLMSVPEPGSEEGEILREIRRRSPKAAVAWSSVPRIERDDRVVVEILAGV
jgi:cell division protein FtsZ